MDVRQRLAPLVDFAFPPRCAACGSAIAAGGSADALCIDCWRTVALPGQPACAACQVPLAMPQTSEHSLCAACIIELPRHDGIHAATIYGGVSRGLVLALKYGGRIALADMMARAIERQLGQAGKFDLVVPVPLHRARLWRRGFNQAALIGRTVARRKRWQFAPDALVRRLATPPLGGLGKRERREALRNAIEVHPKWRTSLEGAEILLVDDVLTSGATTDACVRVLKAASASRVAIACYARVVDDMDDSARQ